MIMNTQSRHIFLGKAVLSAMVSVLALAGCSKDNNDNPTQEESGAFFISATTEDGSYILTTDDLSTGELTTTGSGIELSSAYTWVFNPQYSTAVGLIYAQGSPGVGLAYGLDANGTLVKKGSDFQIVSRFTTYGPFENYVVSSVGAQASAAGDTVSSFTFIDLANNNALRTQTVPTSNFTGNGDYAVFSGIEDAGNGEFFTSAIISSGITAPGTNGLGTVRFVDSVWVAAFDANLNLKRIYRDDRLSYSSGRYRSQLYSQLAQDDNNNLYVFSGAYEATTTKPAGVIRINNGATTFDPNFYINIESLSGGYKFRQVWHITGNYFLIEFYNETGSPSVTSPATKYGVLNVSASTFAWVIGIPSIDLITATGLPFADGGKMYLPITTDSEAPTLYTIDPATASATAGLKVNANGIGAVGKLTY